MVKTKVVMSEIGMTEYQSIEVRKPSAMMDKKSGNIR